MQVKKSALLVAALAVFGTCAIQQAGAAEATQPVQMTGERHHRQLDAASQAKLEKFWTDSQALRKQIAIKHAEKRALMHAKVPDIVAVKKTAGELFDLQTTLADKAREAGVFGPRNFGKQGGKAEKYAANLAKAEKFFTETRDLRRQIAIASAEQKALMRSAQADPQLVAKSAGTLFELRENLRQKAKEAGLSSRFWQQHERGQRHHRQPRMM